MVSTVNANADRIRQIKTFPSLVKYLRDELNWPIEASDFEDLTYDWEPEELGIDKASAAKIDEVKQLRPLADDQPWGIFLRQVRAEATARGRLAPPAQQHGHPQT